MLDNTVFDTSIGDVARDNNIFDPSKSYTPIEFTQNQGGVIPAWERQAAFPVDTVGNFRPTHHTSEKYNTEHTSTTGLAARITSTVNSYTELVLVHVQKSYML